MRKRGQENFEEKSGSQNNGEPEFLAVGKLGKAFGLTGEMKVEVFIDHLEMFQTGQELLIGKKHIPKRIASSRPLGENFLIRFAGLDTPEEARLLTNQYIFIPAGELPELEQGKFYYRQLIGIRVEDAEGNHLGAVSEIIETGANDVYVVTDEKNGKEMLIPALQSVVIKIDIESSLMVVKPPEWLD